MEKTLHTRKDNIYIKLEYSKNTPTLQC